MSDIQSINPYEIFKIPKTTSTKDIKKVYRKLCLIYHPDKQKGKKSTLDIFHKIQVSYLVLSDPERRKFYDTTGTMCPDGPIQKGVTFDSSIFEKVTEEAIEKDKKEYQNSEQESEDIFDVLLETGGNVDAVFKSVPHLEFTLEEEERVYEIIDAYADEYGRSRLPLWYKYDENRKSMRKKLLAKADKERNRFVAMSKAQLEKGKELPSKAILNAELQLKRAKSESDRAKKKAKKADDDIAALKALIKGNSNKHRQAFELIADKYQNAPQDDRDGETYGLSDDDNANSEISEAEEASDADVYD
ncbi:hypothetical protein DAMA08_022310 [Martiniozyma asiatica (nom. inval.)]|nr:hypothetical protein DAMA08_022310 [Martiniozyma asiatica]